MRFCNGCGADLGRSCAQCGLRNPSSARFCGQCSTPFERLSPVHSAIYTTGERRQITVLFCDLVGASGLSQKLDPEDLRDVLRQYQTLCGDVVRRYEGYVAQYMGDGVLVYFGYPTANDDTPQQAVRAGLAIVQAVRELSPRLMQARAVGLEVRVGIHTGAVVVGEMGDADRPQSLAIGETVNMTDRVQRAAEPDSVLVSEATYRLTQGFFNFKNRGPHTLRGFPHPVPLHEVLGETGVRSRLDVAVAGGLTPFVGRERELSVLLAQWAAAKSGQQPVVLLGGEPGIGKSRHVRVLKESLSNERFLSVECFCSQHFQSTALHPITEMLERYLAFSREMTVEERFTRLETEVSRAGLPTPAAVPLLAALLSLPVREGYPPLDMVPQRQRQATFDTLAAWLVESTREQPVLFVMEDLHWADPSTIEFLGLVLKRQAPGPILILLVHRPEFKTPWEHSGMRELNLGRLPAEESQKILSQITRNRSLPAEVTRQVLERADGVPLFVEEIAKAVLESGALREGERQFELVAASSTALTIPSTIHDSLMARLDRLGGTKALAQIAATLGRTFGFEILRAVSGMPEETLRSELDRLVEAQLLFRRGSGANDTYIFKHALIQDAAYESLLRSTRQRYHQQIARTLTEQFPDVASAQPEYLAQHYAGAGLAAEAIAQWTLAGQQAIARSAFAEAIAVFSKALEQLQMLPSSDERDHREIELRAGLGLALISTRGFSSKEVEDTYGRAHELCEKFGDIPIRILFGVWAVQVVRGDREATARLATIFRRIMGTSQDASECLIARACLTTRAFYAAEYDEVRAQAVPGKAYCDSESPRRQNAALMRDYGYEGLLYSHLFLAWTDGIQGRLAECRAGLGEVLDLAERTGHPYVLAMGLGFGSAVWRDIGDATLATEWASRSTGLCVENGFIHWLGICLSVNGWLTRLAGDRDKGRGMMIEGIDIFRQIGASVNYPYYLAYLAEAYIEDDKSDFGSATVEEGLELMGTILASNLEPEFLRLKGQLLARQRMAAEAATYLKKSLLLAREQKAALFELRSALALGRLLSESGRASEARGILAETSSRVPAPLLALKEGQAVGELLRSVS
jgi:class 3 adenylate cyclase/tetratricopeptide (TPR) repeat protein